MRKRLGVGGFLLLLAAGVLRADCTLPQVCADVADSLAVNRGGGVVVTLWESADEPEGLTYYRVVRSQYPENGTWTLVETVEPDHQCGGSADGYQVQEDDPGAGWTYGVQVYGTGGLVCTIVEH